MQTAALREKKTADTAKSFLLLLLKLNYGESKLIWWVVSWTQTLHACNDRSLSSHCCRVAKCVTLLTVHKALPAYHSSLSSDGYQSLIDYNRHFKKLLPDEKKNSICAAAISPCHRIKKWLMRIFRITASFIAGRQNALLANDSFQRTQRLICIISKMAISVTGQFLKPWPNDKQPQWSMLLVTLSLLIWGLMKYVKKM